MAQNALQAVLDRASKEPPAAPASQVPAEAAQPARAVRSTRKPEAERNESELDGAAVDVAAADVSRFHRPSRKDKRLIAGHFDPKVAKQLKLIAVEDDTTVQALLEEALDLLFFKKGRARISEIIRA